jgi:hypothetical protein
MARRIVLTALVFYGALAAAGIAWALVRGIHPLGRVGTWREIALSAGVGLGFAGTTVLVCEVLRTFCGWARRMEQEFAAIISCLSASQVLLLALLSSVAEEVVFRGVLLPEIGLWLSTLAFALLHFPWNLRMVPWPFFALVVGLCFGGMVYFFGGIIGPLVGHFVINTVNLLLIRRRNLRAPVST